MTLGRTQLRLPNASGCARSRPHEAEAKSQQLHDESTRIACIHRRGSFTSPAIMVIPPDPTGPGLLSVTLDMDIGEQQILLKNLQQVLSGLTDPAQPFNDILADIALHRAASTSFTSSKQLNAAAGASTHQGDRQPQFANLSLDRGGSSGSSMLADSAATLKKGGSRRSPFAAQHHHLSGTVSFHAVTAFVASTL